MRYEYKIEQFNDKEFVSADIKWKSLEQRLNDFGDEGWDIQDIQPLRLGGGQSGVVVFLKRQTT